MLLLLHHQRTDGEVDTYHLKPGRKFSFGRGSSCEIRVLDLSLSRQHCAFEFVDGRWTIIDLISTNGCKIDGDPVVGTQVLKDGMAITAGQTSMVAALRPLGDGGSEVVVEQEHLPEDGSGSRPQPELRDSGSEWEPHSVSPRQTTSGVLQPHDLHQPFKAAAPSGDRPYVITLRGRRIGPIPHAQALELKAREQTGQLTDAELDLLPQAG